MAPWLTGIDFLRLLRHVALPMALGGFVAPSRRFWPWLVRWQTPVATNRFLRSVREKYGSRAWSWFPFALRSTLLVLDRDGIDAILASHENFADPFVKKLALSPFTPRGVIVSRCELWKTRRTLNETVLAFGHRKHPDADAFVSIVDDEVQRMLRDHPDVLVWDDFSTLAARISQQVIFGKEEFRSYFAKHVARVVSLSNWGIPRYPQRWWLFDYIDEQLKRHARAPNSHGSLANRLAPWVAANDANAKPSGQAGFWVFVIKDAIELHTVRTLALIVNASDDVRKRLLTEIQAADPPTADTIVGLNLLEGCLREQLRLWTPVPILLRVAVKDFRLGNIQIRAGQQILMHTGFYHRDKEEFGVAADRFSPQDSLAPLYVFSQGRQACAGQFLAIFLLKAVLAALLRHATFALPDQRIDVCQVPAAIDQFALRFSWRPYTDVRHGPARSRTVTEPGSLA